MNPGNLPVHYHRTFMKFRILRVILYGLLCYSVPAHAQGPGLVGNPVPIDSIFRLAIKNSTQLKLAGSRIDAARQQEEVEKLYRLPSLSSGLAYGYVSNSEIWNPSFSKHITDHIPHQLTQFSFEAGQIIFKGNEINNTLKKSGIQVQIAELAKEKSNTDIKFLVAGQYLDIFRLINQRRIFRNNLELARSRLRNIQAMQRQGMVTQNDILRTQLSISDLELAITKTDDNIAITNRQLNVVTGRPDSAELAPDTTLIQKDVVQQPLSYFMAQADSENNELKIAEKQVGIAETNVKLLAADWYPQLALFANNNLIRPYVYSEPKLDIFYNVYQVGLSLKYNLSSLYQVPRKVRAGKIGVEDAKLEQQLKKENVTVAVESDYIRYNQARTELQTYQRDLGSAEENYRIVEKKYYNQLSLLTDMLDASNTKLEAELKVTNAQINLVFAYYRLLHSIGNI